ncbi:MAG: YoaK family protein [Acidobacteriaceae bacterium]
MILAAAAGSADAWSFFGLGHAFVANMTGNTVLAGVSVFRIAGDMAHPVVAVAGYILGTAAGTLLNRRAPTGAIWAKSVSVTLLVEGLVLCLAEAVWAAVHHHPGHGLELVLLAWVAIAIGLQSGSMIQLRIPGVVTTYITGTWTVLTSGVVRLVSRQPRAVRDKTRLEESFALQGALLAAYFFAAALSGWAFRTEADTVGAIPAVAVLVVAVYSGVRGTARS